MKKLIALVALAVIVMASSLVGKDLPSVGYVLVGPKNDGGWYETSSRIPIPDKTWL